MILVNGGNQVGIVEMKKVKVKTVKELSVEELRKELVLKEQEAKEAKRKIEEVEIELEREKFNHLEEAFKKAEEDVEVKLVEANKMLRIAKAIAVTAAEEFGIPVKFDGGVYLPKSSDKWSDEKKYNSEEIEFNQEFLSEIAWTGEADLGEWWYPSSC